ncbi:MAG: MATE family efflux transporter [bacterium]|nr:MATE family efflux transporter [bacterium]
MKNNRVNEFAKHPKKALFKLAYPMVIVVMVQVMYNIVDTAFVGRLGPESIAALTFAFPLFFILIAVNSGVASGMSSRISRFMGEKNKKGAENTAMHGLLMALGIAVVIIAAGLIWLRPIFEFLGARGTVLELSMSYMSVILIGAIIMFPIFIMYHLFASQGDTVTPTLIQCFALVLNIILDPIFIYWLGYGVKGAAIATVVSFTASFLVFIYYVNKKSYLKLGWSYFKFSPKVVREIISVGLPATIMMLILSVFFMYLNWIMVHFGTEYVAALGILMKLESVATMPVIGFSMALMIITGMFYGAKRYDLLKDISWFGVKIAVLFVSVIGAILFIAPGTFIRIFTNEQALIDIGSSFARIYVFALPFSAVTLTTSRILQGMGHGFPGLVFIIIRVLVVIIPVSLLFVFVLGYSYHWVAISLIFGGLAANIVAFTWTIRTFRKLSTH